MTEERKTYHGTAVWEEGAEGKFTGYVVFVEGMPDKYNKVTQGHTWEEAQEMMRDFIAIVLDIDPQSFDIELRVQEDEKDLNKRLKRGIEQAERGETRDRGSFAQYLEENEGDNT